VLYYVSLKSRRRSFPVRKHGFLELSCSPEKLTSSSATKPQPDQANSPKMSQFRAKKLDLGCFVNIRVIRDHTKRKVFEEYETQRYKTFLHPRHPLLRAILIAIRALFCRASNSCWRGKTLWMMRLTTAFRRGKIYRQALRYIIRNTTLPARARAEAQLQLTQMHCYTRPTQIRNRCILGGKGRGIFRDFKMSRVCVID